jgi:hypothetical protein
LDQQIHAAIVLGDELLVASRIEDLTLEHDDCDDEAVQDLHAEVAPIYLQAVSMSCLTLGADKVLVAEQVF